MFSIGVYPFPTVPICSNNGLGFLSVRVEGMIPVSVVSTYTAPNTESAAPSSSKRRHPWLAGSRCGETHYDARRNVYSTGQSCTLLRYYYSASTIIAGVNPEYA